MRVHYWPAIGMLLLLTGCGLLSGADDSGGVQEHELISLKAQIATTEAVNTANTAEIAALTERLDTAYMRIISLESRSLDSADLTPGDATYRTLKTDVGSLLVSLTDVQPYANGSQVKLAIGNPTSLSIFNPKAKFMWGQNTKAGYPDYKSGKSRTISFDASILPAGRWTTVVLKLDGVPPSELDFITVSGITWQSVML